MLAAQRFETAAPLPAIDVAGEDLASSSTTWTALPDLGETTLSAAGSRRELDYMHARFHSPLVARMMSVDPVLVTRRATKRPQSWNRYAYVVGNPMKYVDPTGETLNLVFDFSRSDLTAQQRAAVIQGVKAAYLKAGVKDVRTHHKGGSFQGDDRGGTSAVVHLSFQSQSLNQGSNPVHGVTSGNGITGLSNKSVISSANAPQGEAGINFLINVGAHEAGHGSQALRQYDMDALFDNAEPGFIMESHVPANELGTERRVFSESDAAALRDALNRPEDE